MEPRRPRWDSTVGFHCTGARSGRSRVWSPTWESRPINGDADRRAGTGRQGDRHVTSHMSDVLCRLILVRHLGCNTSFVLCTGGDTFLLSVYTKERFFCLFAGCWTSLRAIGTHSSDLLPAELSVEYGWKIGHSAFCSLFASLPDIHSYIRTYISI